MKKFLALVIIFACLADSKIVSAQTADENAVAAAVETLRKAMLDRDKSTLEKITAEKLTYGHSSGLTENRTEFIEALSSGKSDFKQIDITDQKILITGNTAIVRHVFKGISGANQINLSVMLVWLKDGKEWKLLARQAIKNL